MSKGHILLIDDDPGFLGMMHEIVEMDGYTFSGVEEAGDLAVLLHQHCPDLVLLDFCLKGRNGGELCYLLKEEMGSPLPVVLLSAYPEAQLPLARIPYTIFIPKPFDCWIFLACIGELMRNVKK